MIDNIFFIAAIHHRRQINGIPLHNVGILLQQFEGDTGKIWQSNIFGRSFNEIAGEDLNAKLKRMPTDAQSKLREALERILNEGGAGLICIIL